VRRDELDLTISHEIVCHTGGYLALRFTLSTGTRVYFDIEAPAQVGKVSLEDPHILLLGQGPDIRKLLTIFFKTTSAELLEAGEQQKAL